MKSIITLSMVLFALSSWAQDIIIKNDKSELKTKVLEITEATVKYKKFEMQDGPTYNINKSEVFMIIYKNGTKEYIDNSNQQVVVRGTTVVNSQTNGQNNVKATNRAVNDNTDKLAFGPGHNALHFGLGLGSGGFAAAGGTMVLPPIQLRYEFAVSPKISLGAIAALAAVDYGNGGSGYSGSVESFYFMFGGRGNYHFATSEKFDPYVGATLGYNAISTESSVGGYGASASGGEVFIGGQIGANYYFSPKFGAWAELGYGIGIFNLGITLKLNKK